MSRDQEGVGRQDLPLYGPAVDYRAARSGEAGAGDPPGPDAPGPDAPGAEAVAGGGDELGAGEEVSAIEEVSGIDEVSAIDEADPALPPAPDPPLASGPPPHPILPPPSLPASPRQERRPEGVRLSSGVRILDPGQDLPDPLPKSRRQSEAPPPRPPLPAIPPPARARGAGRVVVGQQRPRRPIPPPPVAPPPPVIRPPLVEDGPISVADVAPPETGVAPSDAGVAPEPAPSEVVPEPAPDELAPDEVEGPLDEVPAASSFSRNTMLMATGTLVSRLTGFGKVLALAWVLGINRLADAYNLANNLPNQIYDLVLGGVLSATLIPVLVEEMGRRNQREGWRAISAVVTTVLAVLVVLSVVFWLIAPGIIDLLLISAHGPGVGPERNIAVHLLRLFVPQLLFLGGIALTTALLNARRQFAAPAFSPVLCNVVTIAAIVASGAVAHSLALSRFERDETAIVVLGLGTTAGYLVQLAAQLPSLWKAKVHLRWVWQPGHPAVRTVLRLSAWTFGAVVANQVSFYVVQLLASDKSGDVSAFNYAYMFFQLPYAIFAVSIASVVAPDLAQRWSSGQVRAFRARMGAGLRLTLAILVPAGVGYAIVAQPLLRLALRHGHVSVGEAHLAATLVAIFACGLPGFSAFLFLMRGYQAMKDTRSMFWIYLIENALTLVVAIALFPAFGVRGLVVGWVGAYSVMSLVAFAHLGRRANGLQGSAVFVTAFRVALATAAMAIVLEVLLAVLPSGGSIAVLVVQVAVLALVGTGVYVLSALFLGIKEIRQVVTIRSARRSNAHQHVFDPSPEGGNVRHPSGN